MERSEAAEGSDEIVRLPAGRCDKCRRWRRGGQGVECVSCRKRVHVKCAEMGTRGQRERVSRNTWQCRECWEQKERLSRNVGSQAQGSRQGDGGDPERSLVVAQWNCNHLRTKIPELEVWLRENEVDVAVIQETRLRAEDEES